MRPTRRHRKSPMLSILVATALVCGAAHSTSAQAPPARPAPPPAPPAAPPTAPPGALPLPPPPPMAGVWIDHTGRGAVEIAPCGNRLCGYIVWLKSPTDAKGQPLRDARNPEPTKRTGTICGLQIIGDLAAQRDGSFDLGWIYDPEKGQRFDVELTLLRGDILQVKGYLGVKFLNETYQWRRAAPTVERCRV